MSDRLKAYARMRKARVRLFELTCPSLVTPANQEARNNVIDAIYEFEAAVFRAGEARMLWRLSKGSSRRR